MIEWVLEYLKFNKTREGNDLPQDDEIYNKINNLSRLSKHIGRYEDGTLNGSDLKCYNVFVMEEIKRLLDIQADGQMPSDKTIGGGDDSFNTFFPDAAMLKDKTIGIDDEVFEEEKDGKKSNKDNENSRYGKAVSNYFRCLNKNK